MTEMLDVYTAPLRTFMAADFLSTRKKLGLSQLKMAELLDIDLKSYSNLEHGKSLCSTRVFLLYTLRCKTDQAQFMREIGTVFKEAEENLLK